MDHLQGALDVADKFATIGTAVVALWVGISYKLDRKRRRLALEHYLYSQQPTAANSGARSLLHLVAQLMMSEADVLTAAFDSDKVETARRQDEDGVTKEVLLRYRRDAAAKL